MSASCFLLDQGGKCLCQLLIVGSGAFCHFPPVDFAYRNQFRACAGEETFIRVVEIVGCEDCLTSRDAVGDRQLRHLIQERGDLVGRTRALEQRRHLPADQGDDGRYALHAEALGQPRLRIDVDAGARPQERHLAETHDVGGVRLARPFKIVELGPIGMYTERFDEMHRTLRRDASNQAAEAVLALLKDR